MKKYCYYYIHLNDDEKELYRNIVEAIEDRRREVHADRYTEEILDKVLHAIEFDHPEWYFWHVDRGSIRHKTQIITRKKETIVDISYSLSKVKMDEATKRLDEYAHKKIVRFQKYVITPACLSAICEEILTWARREKENPQTDVMSNTIYSVIHKYICTTNLGASKMVKFVLDVMGVQNYINENEENYVCLNGMWFCLNSLGIQKNDLNSDRANDNCRITEEQQDTSSAIGNENDATDVQMEADPLNDNSVSKDGNYNLQQEVDVSDEVTCPQNNRCIPPEDTVYSDTELRRYIQNKASELPFELAVTLSWDNRISETAEKAATYIVKHYLLKGQKVVISYQYDNDKRYLFIQGESVEFN